MSTLLSKHWRNLTDDNLYGELRSENKIQNIIEQAVSLPMPEYRPKAVSAMILQLAFYHHTAEELCSLAMQLGVAMHTQHYRQGFPLDEPLFDCAMYITWAAQELEGYLKEDEHEKPN